MTLDFSSFEKALTSLQRVLARSATAPTDDDLRDACIQRFEYTYELAFKMLKRQLEQELPSSEELDHLPFKEIIRIGAERGLITVPERWFDYRDKRNITSHTYDEQKAREVYAVLSDFAVDATDLLSRLMTRHA
jgi:nucleotidyltransferase substrate binding protein (TIGR01987 family)